MDINNLELNISFEKNTWIAKTPSFPKCKGSGETESEAIDKLVNSITRFISKRTKQYLGDMLHSKQYTQVILDSSTDSKTHKRLFPLDGGFSNLSKMFFVKVKDLSNIKDAKPADIKQSDMSMMDFTQEEAELLSNTLVSSSNEEGETMYVKRLTQGHSEDGYVFGFPLSFN